VPGIFAAPGPTALHPQAGLRVTRRMKRNGAGTSIPLLAGRPLPRAALSTEAVRAKLRNGSPPATYALRDAGTGIFHYPNGLVEMVDFTAGDKNRRHARDHRRGTYRENAADENGVMRAASSGAPRSRSRCAGAPATSAPSCFTNTIHNLHGARTGAGSSGPPCARSRRR
jgi:DNA gyrase subunit B